MLLEHLFLTAWKQGTHDTHCFGNFWYCIGSHTHPIINPTSLGPVYPLDTSFSQVYKECIRGQEPLLDIHRKKGVGTVFKFFSSSWILTHLYIFHLTPKSKLSILTKVQPQNFVGHWRIGRTSQIPPSLLVSALESQRGTRPKKVKLHWGERESSETIGLILIFPCSHSYAKNAAPSE